MDLKDLNFKHWWTMMAASGALIAAASVVPKSSLGVIAGLSLLFFGLGEWINHPRTPTKETMEGMRGFKVVDGYPWKPSFLGVVFDAIGVIFFGVTVYLIWVIARQISN